MLLQSAFSGTTLNLRSKLEIVQEAGLPRLLERFESYRDPI